MICYIIWEAGESIRLEFADLISLLLLIS